MKALVRLVASRFLARSAFRLQLARASSHPSFKFKDLHINLAIDYGAKPPPDFANLMFGHTFSDHMLEVTWTEDKGWDIPRIVPLHFFQFHPGSKVLHYAQAAFEGMKAFRYSNQTIALFRPDLNVNRLMASAKRACLPPFDANELMDCMKKLVSIDHMWVPDQENSSLYLRPTYIGVENTLGVTSSNKALLYIVTCPVGPYFKTGVQPVSLLADPQYVRACPGGVGSFKMAANYAPSLFVQKTAQQKGYDQVLWLLGEDHQVTEAGAMNAFFVFKKGSSVELVTPNLDGTILPGVVRQSVLELARSWGEFDVQERRLTMRDVLDASKQDNLLEMFLCGTACSVCPVKLIGFKGENINIPTMQSNLQLHGRIAKALSDIQYGRVNSNWSVPISHFHTDCC